jgi:hypothetical protein
VDRLSEVLGAAVQCRYTCLDRIVLPGYLMGLQRPEQLVDCFHDVVGIACIEPRVLAGRTAAYRTWLGRYTQQQGIPVLAAPKGVRKADLVRPYYGRLGPKEGIACVLTSLETSRTFISYPPSRSRGVVIPTLGGSRPAASGSCTSTGTGGTRSWGQCACGWRAPCRSPAPAP